MPDDERLRERFAGFGRYSAQVTAPPGIAAVTRTIARRRARRVTAVAVAVVLAILMLAIPVWSRTRPVPPGVNPSPSISGTTNAPDSVAPLPAAPPAPSSPSPSRSVDWCAPSQSWNASVFSDGDPSAKYSMYVTIPSDYFQRCPQARLRMVWASYGWSPTQHQLVLSHSDVFYLTATMLKTPVLEPTPPDNADACGYAAFVARSDRSVPATVPASIQNATGAEFLNWVALTGQQVRTRWTVTSVAQELADPRCTPPTTSPSVSATP